jgi:hypothetical protein
MVINIQQRFKHLKMNYRQTEKTTKFSIQYRLINKLATPSK